MDISSMFENYHDPRIEPKDRSREVFNMVELLDWDFQRGIEDCLNDSTRCDVKQLLSELELSIDRLRQDIIATSQKLASLPESI
jgi:hypothetical protein